MKLSKIVVALALVQIGCDSVDRDLGDAGDTASGDESADAGAEDGQSSGQADDGDDPDEPGTTTVGTGAGDDSTGEDYEDLYGEPCTEAQYQSVHQCGADGQTQWCDAMFDGATGTLVYTWGPCLEGASCELGQVRACDWGGEEVCSLDGQGEPSWSGCDTGGGEEEDTPLVIAFGGAQPQLVASAATFDLAGTGGCLVHDWPTAATPWLAIDLDRSGTIDGGHELFGSGTVLPSGRRAKDGFVALAQLDSDGDRAITPADARFGELVLWSDHDGDKRSSHWEHESLAARGIESISLGYASEPTCDFRGNCGVERAAVGTTMGAAEVVDLHLACQ